jgi:hypothetical protein
MFRRRARDAAVQEPAFPDAPMLGVLSLEEIETLLATEWVVRLGCHANALTYVVPITYAYDGLAIYGHTTGGLKLRMLRENPQVCIEVDHVDDLANWRSVIAWGRFEELHGDAAASALRLLLDRVGPMMISETAIPSHGRVSPHHAGAAEHEAVVFRVVLDRKTGRFERR